MGGAPHRAPAARETLDRGDLSSGDGNDAPDPPSARQQEAPRTGTLHVAVYPPTAFGLLITVDGKPVGHESPVTVSITPGKHFVEARAVSMIPNGTTIEIAAGTTIEKTFALLPIAQPPRSHSKD